MQITFDRAKLLDALAFAQGVLERKGTVPILGHVLFEPTAEGFRLSATEMEVGARIDVAPQGQRELDAADHPFTLNGVKLFQIVKESVGDEIELRSLDSDWMEIRCGRSKFKMIGRDPRSFPAMPAGVEKTGALRLPAAKLASMIDHVIFAISPNEARYNLSGVYLEALSEGTARMVATNGHRLAMIDAEAPGFSAKRGVIIPTKGMRQIRALLDDDGEEEVELTIGQEICALSAHGRHLTSRLVEGEFPDYRGGVPTRFAHAATVKRDAMIAAVRRCTLMSDERYHGVRLEFRAGQMWLSSRDAQGSEARDEIDTDLPLEDPIAIGFNARYLLDALGCMPKESDAVLNFSDEVSPIMIARPTEPSWQAVIMPMRL